MQPLAVTAPPPDLATVWVAAVTDVIVDPDKTQVAEVVVVPAVKLTVRPADMVKEVKVPEPVSLSENAPVELSEKVPNVLSPVVNVCSAVRTPLSMIVAAAPLKVTPALAEKTVPLTVIPNVHVPLPMVNVDPETVVSDLHVTFWFVAVNAPLVITRVLVAPVTKLSLSASDPFAQSTSKFLAHVRVPDARVLAPLPENVYVVVDAVSTIPLTSVIEP